MLAVVPGARDAEGVEEVVAEVKDRTGGRVMDLMTSDNDVPAWSRRQVADHRRFQVDPGLAHRDLSLAATDEAVG